MRLMPKLRDFILLGLYKFQVLKKQGDLLPDKNGFSVLFVINEGKDTEFLQ